jgi:hypothetical protein
VKYSLSHITAKFKLIFVRIHLPKINLQPISRCVTSMFDLQSNLVSCFVHPAANEYVETVHSALPWNLVTRLGNWMNFNPCLS